ncbi:ABC transporter ATP-binding protein [Gordonia terrae]|nr:ABC transporter ATP-binding protein [Gordonia terrae]ANY21840.1 ABC transporter ATP-binding protein [Gordonia terrae]GAB44651.1 putative ABC transporter ATP-binding protein [Gordonia terrae NBRC 100016]VTR09158.1 ABC transporter [Clostridioides difficile]VTS22089.1 Bicarbonate transport ATP-binding protein CmpD [Gordonia terrae]
MTTVTPNTRKSGKHMSEAVRAADPVAEPRVSFTNIRQVFELPKQSKKDTSAASTVVALDNVTLEIPDGQFVALVGASGCGKTTLMNMVAGLVKPTHGTVKVNGEAPRLPNLDIGYMFARDALLPWRSARRSVELPLEVRGWDRQRRRERADEMLDLVGLRDKHTQYRNQLSQGMRQRVALARTLASDPSILLMDEPFAALDARTKLTLEGEFLRIWENGGDERKTVIFVTHDLDEAVLLADRVVIMLPRPGRIAEDIIVDLPRPRADHLGEVRYTEEFREITQNLFDSLEGAIASTAPDAVNER